MAIQKITQYPAKTVFRNEDVYDVSTYDGVNPVGSDSSYQTEKVTWAQLLAALTGSNIYTADGTILANRTISVGGKWVIWQECYMAINMASANSSLDLSPPVSGTEDIFNCWDLGAQNVFKITKDGEVTGIGKFGLGGSSLITPNVTLDVEGAVANRAITDSLGASVNNYSVGNGSYLRLNNTAGSIIDVTGIANGFNGRILNIRNIGTDGILFKHQSTSSTAANRLVNGFGGNDDELLAPNDTIQYVYDSTSSRWYKKGVTKTALEDKETVLFKTTTETTLTGTTAETVVSTHDLQIGDIIAEDLLFTHARAIKDNLAGALTLKVYVNATPNLSGSPVLLATGFSNVRNIDFRRTFVVFSASRVGTWGAPTFNTFSDITTTNTVTTDATGMNFAILQYLVFTLQLGDASDTAKMQFLTYKRTRKW